MGTNRPLVPAAAALMLVAVLLAGQSAADAMLPSATGSETGRLLGRTGFAYLTGIRSFAAAALWVRLDPLNDRYYNDSSLGQKTFLLPSIRIVTWLDPDLEEPYYVGPFVLYEAGKPEDALVLAREGVERNPESAFLHSSYAQLLMVVDDLDAARREADLAMSLPWANESDRYQLLAPLEVIYDNAGLPHRAAEVRARRQQLREKFGAEIEAFEEE